MSALDPASLDETLEECIEELAQFIASCSRYSDGVLAYALKAQLASLLSVLLEQGLCEPEQAQIFIRDLEQEALQLVDED